MRLFAAIAVAAAATLAGCAAYSPAPSPAPAAAVAVAGESGCNWAHVPPGAVFGTRYGGDTATFPTMVPHGDAGCQRVWYGQRGHPEAMEVLATYYYERGHVRRLVGHVPRGGSYDCHYRGGVLDAGRSQNPRLCPKASEIE